MVRHGAHWRPCSWPVVAGEKRVPGAEAGGLGEVRWEEHWMLSEEWSSRGCHLGGALTLQSGQSSLEQQVCPLPQGCGLPGICSDAPPVGPRIPTHKNLPGKWTY